MCAAAGVRAEIPYVRMERIIAECDVADCVEFAPDAPSFWKNLQGTNRDYRKAAKSLAGKGDRDIKRQLIDVLSNCHSYFAGVPTRSDTYDLMETLAERMGIRATSPLTSFTVTQEPDIALFGYPNGYIFMSGALYSELEGDTLAIEALLASEAAHYALQHAYAHSKWEKKRHKRTRLLRILAASALAVGSAVAEQASDGWFPAEIGIGAATLVAISPISRRYTMSYTPQQMHEADIVAYRYMEWRHGSGESYIRALRRVGNDIDATSGIGGKDYPSVAERIALLEYMRDNPDLRPRVKGVHKQPREIPHYFDIFSPANYR